MQNMLRATSFLKYQAYSTKYSMNVKLDFSKRRKELQTLKAFQTVEGFVPNVQGFELNAA